MSETVFTYAAPALKLGRGAVREIGYDVAQLITGRERRVHRVLVVTDPGVAAAGHAETVRAALEAGGKLISFTQHRGTLEELFVRRAEEQKRGQAATAAA